MLASSSYPLLGAFLSILEFFLFFIWLYLLFVVFGDIIRSPDLGGGAKALWSIVIIVLPYIGVFIYLIARGATMHERAERRAERQDEAFQQYVRQAAGPETSTSDQLAKLVNLRDEGKISEEDFQRGKAKILG